MQLSYNVTGPARKALVVAISDTLDGAEAKYLGAPTMAYQVGDYHIDKTGTVTGPDNLDLEDALHRAGYDADGDTREYDEPDTYENCLGGMGAVPSPEEFLAEQPAINSEPMSLFDSAGADEVTEPPAADAEPMSLFDSAAQEPAIAVEPEDGHQPDEVPQEAEFTAEANDGPQETESPQEADAAPQEAAPEENGCLTIEVPLAGFTVEALENLNRMVMAKASLLTAAIGANSLPIIRKAETVAFPWFPTDAGAEHIQAYTTLAAQLSKTAKEKKRVNAKAKDTEGSPKYAMRCFLLGIGMIGPEFKDTRKILLSRLSGSSSFSNTKQCRRN